MWGAIKKTINSNLNKSLDILIKEKATEINNKIYSKANQKNLENLSVKIENIKIEDDINNLKQKAIEINSDINKLLLGGTIKSIQRGVGESSTAFSTDQINIYSVEPNKCMINVTPEYSSSHYKLAEAPIILNLKSNVIEYIVPHYGNHNTGFSWELIEFY